MTAKKSTKKVATQKTSASKKTAGNTTVQALSPAQQGLKKLGLERDIDFALHLPLRYEDETHITPLRDALHGQNIQVEGEITQQEIVNRGKRQLLVTLKDGDETLRMRFFSFYPHF